MFSTGTLWNTRILHHITTNTQTQPENFQKTLLISSKFPGYPGGKNYSSRFPGFPGVLDTLFSLVTCGSSPTSSITSFPSSAADMVDGRNLTIQMLTSWRAWIVSRCRLWAVRQPDSDVTSTSSPCSSSSLDSSRSRSSCCRSAVMSTASCTPQPLTL